MTDPSKLENSSAPQHAPEATPPTATQSTCQSTCQSASQGAFQGAPDAATEAALAPTTATEAALAPTTATEAALAPTTVAETGSTASRASILWRRLMLLTTVLFWAWNMAFVCVTMSVTTVMPQVLVAVIFDDLPIDYAGTMLLAWLTPWFCVALTLWRLRARREAIAFLFFAVEGPFFVLSILRLVAMREVTPAVMQWAIMITFGLSVYGVDYLLTPLPRTKGWHALRLVATTCLGLVGTCVGVLTLLVTAPVSLRAVAEMAKPSNWEFLAFSHWRWEALGALTTLFPVLLLVILTLGSLAVMPVCMVFLYVRALVRTWREGELPIHLRATTVVGTLLVQAMVYAIVNHQPQREVLARLEAGTVTPAQLHAEESFLRKSLCNAYLGAYRYASSTGEANGIAELYRDRLGLSTQSAAVPQAIFNALARPMLYDGESLSADATRAAELYERYFDLPIQRGERNEIVRALSATYNEESRESGLIQVDQRRVLVAEQHVDVEAHGDLAVITLEETYVNLTTENQELFYLFSLPESAAITGLWLGNAREAMQEHTIAPRGAAQRVYRAQVQRRVDPALLEQVGPRQYRLRAFPVPPRPRMANGIPDHPQDKLYLRMRYRAFAEGGRWPLPVLAEKRNVGWDRHTHRVCAGGACPGNGTTWWPPGLPISAPATATPRLHAASLGATGKSLVARPANARPSSAPGARPEPCAAGTPCSVVSGKRVNLVVDRSWSMREHGEELLAAIRWARVQMAGNDVLVLPTTTPAMQTKDKKNSPPQWVPLSSPLEADLTRFMGGGTVDSMLQQAVTTSPRPADLTVVLTDAGAFALDADKTRARLQEGMLSMVHLGGTLAPAYDDATLEMVQRSGGSSFTTLAQAWEHFAQMQSAPPGFVGQRDGYVFTVEDASASPPDPTFAPMAARLFIAQATRQSEPLDVATFDTLHTLAREASVVTPYSSMLVLVNEAQKAALQEEEAKENRFDRATETGKAVLDKPFNPLHASAAPEPEEWLLMLITLGAAGWMVRSAMSSRSKLALS